MQGERVSWAPERGIAAGDTVEVSWALAGHPAARWEAEVTDTIDPAPPGHAPSSKLLVKVSYRGWSDLWDEWIPASSTRLHPPGAAPFAPDHFGKAPASATGRVASLGTSWRFANERRLDYS